MKKNNSQFRQCLFETRRDFHMHPEISHQETRTTAKIITILKELGCEVSAFDDMTGAVGLIKGNFPGPTIGLRADIDALPIQKLNDVPYKSQNPGAMHAATIPIRPSCSEWRSLRKRLSDIWNRNGNCRIRNGLKGFQVSCVRCQV